MMPQKLEFTGERYVPEVHGNIEIEHLHRYLQACEIAFGKVVLDIASGEGYGSAMLAERARKVIGVDISVDAVEHARKRYGKANLEYMVGSCADIPLPDASVDMVVSFETIEHHDQHDKMMQEIKRVLRPTGILLISSPDKYHYSVEPGYSNPFHVKELYQQEFKQLLGRHFKNAAYFGQRIIYGSCVFAESLLTQPSSYWQENEAINKAPGLVKPVYWIALASDVQLPELASSVYEQPINESEIVKSWSGVVAERDGQIASLAQAVAERDGQITALTQAVETILSSRSWKVTRPVRAISASLRGCSLKAREVLLSSPSKFAVLLNIRPIINKVIRRLRRIVLASRLSTSTAPFFSTDTPADYQEALKETCKKKLILISMVKNEASIIETFGGHALSLFDRIILVDHRSTDGTKQYVEALAKQYPAVEHFSFEEPGYYQSQLMTWIVKTVVDCEAPSWVFFLDADEFLPFESREELNRELAKHNSSPVISMPWLNLVPLNMQSGQVIGERFFKPNRYAGHCKIAFQPNLIPLDDYVVAQGNHALLMGPDYGVEFPAKLAFPIYHFPIRTMQQLRNKILHGVESYRSMGDSRADGLGVHWDEINQIMSSHGLTDELMAGMIVRYGQPLTPPYEKTFDELIVDGHTVIQMNISYSSPLSMSDVVQSSTFNGEDAKSPIPDMQDKKEWNRIALDPEKRILRFQ